MSIDFTKVTELTCLGKKISELSYDGKIIWKLASDMFMAYFNHFVASAKIQTDTTGVIAEGDIIEVDVKCPFDLASGTLRPNIIGTSLSSTTSKGCVLLEKLNGNCCIRVYWLDSDRSVSWVVHSLDGTWETEYHRYKIDYGAKKIWCDGTEVTGTMATGSNTTPNRFGFGKTSTQSNSQPFDLRQCKLISSDGTLKRWYVPIVDNGKAGIVDVVSGTKTLTTYTTMAGDIFDQQTKGCHKVYLSGIKANDVVRTQYVRSAESGKTCTIDWGDGTSETFDISPTSAASKSHTYSAAGDYVVTFTGNDIKFFFGTMVYKPLIRTGSTAGANSMKKVIFGDGTGFLYANSYNFNGANWTDKAIHLESIEFPKSITSLGNGSQAYNYCTFEKTRLWSQKKMELGTQFSKAIDPATSELYVLPWLVSQYKEDTAYTAIFGDRIYPLLPEEFN